MSRYINQDKLAEFARHSTNGIDANDIMRFPSIEIIHCKDCKHSESVPKWKDFELGCMLHREYTTATDFCSQAERRESE